MPALCLAAKPHYWGQSAIVVVAPRIQWAAAAWGIHQAQLVAYHQLQENAAAVVAVAAVAAVAAAAVAELALLLQLLLWTPVLLALLLLLLDLQLLMLRQT